MMVRRRRDLEKAREEHDRYIDPEQATRDNDFIVQTRGEDSSIWWRTSWYLQKYLAAWAPLATLGAALGFTLITPKRSADEIKARVDSVNAMHQRQIDAIKVDQAQIRATYEVIQHDVGLVVRYLCVSRTASAYDKTLIGLTDAKGECIR